MSFASEYEKAERERKKRLQEEQKKIDSELSGKSTFAKEYESAELKRKVEESDDDIAPVRAATTNTTTEKEEDQKWWQGWFQKGAFSDGYDFGDVTKTLLGTFRDVEENVLEAVGVATENIIDSGAELAGQIGGWFGNKDFEEKMYKWANGTDLLQSEQTAKTFSNIMNWTNPVGTVSNLILGNGVSESNAEEYSVLGEKSDGLVQSAADMVGAQALKAIPVVGAVLSPVAMFNNAYRAEMRNAYENGATVDEAQRSALISGAAELIFEQIGGLKVFNKMGLDDLAKKGIAKLTANRLVRTLGSYGVSIGSEALEEVLTEAASRTGQYWNYLEEDPTFVGSLEHLSNEEALQTYIDAAIGGAVMGFAGGAPNVANSVRTGRDLATGLTANEEAVVQKVYDAELAEAEKSGKKVNKNELWDDIVKRMDNGEIDIDTIEEVLGGEDYTAYKNLVAEEDSHIEELKTLFEGEELEAEISDYRKNSQRSDLAMQLEQNVFDKISGDKTTGKNADRLLNSYVERDNNYKKFEADVSQYKGEYAQKTIQNIINSESANNTRRMHRIADMLARISEDKQVEIDVTTMKKLADTSLGVQEEGQIVDGFVTKIDGETKKITFNLDSPKYFESLAGHELTHVLEGTGLYQEFSDLIEQYARDTGIYDARLKTAWKLYKNKKGYTGVEGFKAIKKEVIADLAGDYLFQDAEFVKRLTTNRKLYQKVWDEIKYLSSIVQAGSEEEKKLLKAMKAFENAYNADTKARKKNGTKTNADGEVSTQLSVSETVDGKPVAVVDDDILSGIDTTTWDDAKKETAKKAAFNALKQFKDGIVVNGVTRNVNQKSRKEYTRSNDTEKLYKRDKGIFADKMRAADVADDIVKATTDWVRDGKLKHGRTDNFVDFDHGNVLIMSGNAKYEAEVVVGITNTGEAVFYDVVNMTPTAFDIKNEKSPTTATTQNAIGDIQGDSSVDPIIAEDGKKVNDESLNFSISDSDGKTLTEGQKTYFKDSKMRDDNGNLKVMYHGSQDAGFHVFDSRMSDDDTSFFFVDRNDVAASYSGTSETYEAKTIRTAEDMDNFLAEIGYDHYRAVEKDGKFELLENNEHVATSDTAQGIYEEFCWYEGVGDGDANYKVYLNLTNPLEIDAKGKNWNNISREFSQEVADKYNSLTAEEKAALLDLAEWGDFQTFRDEILSVLEHQSIAPIGEDQKHLASAIDKLGGNNINISNLFSIASDNFSAESIQEFAVKQMNTRDYAKKAKAEGYDGVIFKNIHDNGGYSNGSEGASTVAIAFDSNQIKSVANQNPTADPDIRYSLSEDTDGRKLSKEQQNYFKDVVPELKDKNGNLKVLYHGTPNSFTQFNYDFIGSNGTALGKGFYLTERKDVAEGYVGENGNVMELYANITKPMSLNDMTISEEEYRKFVVAVDKATEGQYLTNFGEVEYEGYNTVLNRALEDYEYNDNDVDLIHSVFNAGGLSWEEGFRLLKDTLGYDGVVENNYAGTGSSVFVPTLPEQIKSVDNRTPTDNPDINLSLSEDGISPVKYGNRATPTRDLRLKNRETNIAPVAEGVAKNATTPTEIVGNDIPVEDIAPSPMAESPLQDWRAMAQEGTDAESVIQAATTEAVNNVVSGMTSEELSQKADAALNEFAQLRAKKNLTEAENVLYRAFREQCRVYELYANNPDLANELRGTFADDIAPIDAETEAELNRERLESLDDSDIPPMAEEPYYGEPETPIAPSNPFDERDYSDMAHAKSYVEENPEVRPYFIEAAQGMLYDVKNSTKGERYTINDEDGYIIGWQGTKRNTTQDIADLKDGQYHYTYGQIEDALNRIINGEKLNALAKRLEFDLHDRLVNGYTDVDGQQVPANQEYIDLMRFKQETDEAYQQYQESVDYIDDDVAPPVESAPAAPVAENISPVKQTEPKKQPQTAETDDSVGEERVARVLTQEPDTKRKKRGIWSYIKEFVLDNGMVFEDVAKKAKNRNVEGKWNQIRNADKMAQYFVKNGRDGVRSIDSIKTEVEKKGLTEQLYNYMYHQHNVDRMSLESRVAPKLAEVRESLSGLDDAQIAELAKERITRQTSEEDAAKIRSAREYTHLAEFKNKPVFGDSVTAEMSKQEAAKLEKANPELKQYAEEIYANMKTLRQLLVDNGIVSQETADLWDSLYPHYVPIRRANHNGAAINVPLDTFKTGVNAPIKRATGGNGDILPLFDTIGQRAVQTFKAVTKNNFGVELKNVLGSTISETDSMIDDVDSVDNHEELLKKGENGMNPTFTVFENGKRVEFEISEEMYEAMKPAEGMWSYTNKALNAIGNFRRGTLTEYNALFLAKNAFKDVQDVLINSQHPARTYANMPVAISEMVTKGEYLREYLENGGESNTYFDSETNTFTEENKVKKFLMDVTGLNAVAKANNVVEMLPRLAEYIASRKAGRSIEVSMLDAARVTTNFAAGGKATKMLSRNGFTFLNASVQGAVQQVRNIREAKMNGLRGAIGLAAKFAVAGIPFVILNNLRWDDDEDYEELSDYVKQNYYIVAKYGDGKFVRIPKGRTVAVIQNAFEQMGNLITGDDEADFGTFIELAVSNLAPNDPLENNVLSPIRNVIENKTWYGEDLVPQRLQNLPANEQYDESTDEISKWLADTEIGKKFGWSPYKINYLLDQYSGFVGDSVLPLLTPEAEATDVPIVENMEEGFGKNVAKAFIAPAYDAFTTDSTMKNQNVSDFYTLKDELTVKANASTATDEDYLKSSYMNAINSELSELYAQKREIQNDKYLSDEDKYEKVRSIQQEIVDLTREALNSYGDVNIQGTYATVGDVQYRYYTPSEDSTAEAGWRKLSADQIQKQNKVTSGLRISASEYWSNKEEYDYAYEYPEKYAVAKSVGGYKTFRKLSSELYDIKADKDSSGKSISGSRKNKVIDYINGLDLDYGEKIILFKSEYNADDTYNYEIIDYLNSRRDLSYKEIETILKELGFTVDSEGNIYWD